jgi:tetratricopeptide (TPR) repeat protein
MDRVLSINPVYGEAYAIAAHFFVLNRRYEEGIEFYRKALELNPRHWEARTQLGVNLMRLGLDDEAMRNLETSYNNGYQSPATVNTLRLLDSYANFITYTTDKTLVRLHKEEAELLRPYVEGELQRAIETFEQKYGIELGGPVRLEVYPDHEDFAVRTMGMPGLGALGVTFGRVVAMDSPSSRPAGTYHWASTLWHELSHVFCLEATGHRVPRWFTEGLAVHEETAVSPEWGDRIQGPMIEAINKGMLLPITELERGFIRPSFPGQIGLSYFQAGRICDYINERWGYGTLIAMMHSFGELKETPDVVREHLGIEPEQFDREFLSWLDDQIGETIEGYETWQEQIKGLHDAAEKGFPDLVIELGEQVRDLYPQYVEAGNAYQLVAEAHLEKGNREAAAAELDRYMRIGGRNPALLKQLANLEEEFGRPERAAAVLERLNYIYPVNDEDLHRRLGELWLEEENVEGAIREFQSVIAMDPLDLANSQFNLARAYHLASRHDEAMDHVVSALEAAPGFRPAQRLLLELSQTE